MWVKLNKDYVQSLESLGFNRMATGQVWVRDPPIPRSRPTSLCSRGELSFPCPCPTEYQRGALPQYEFLTNHFFSHSFWLNYVEQKNPLEMSNGTME